tara:strand:- start:11615 stop:13783 length:2169 start_codon:yes stop_codon:yes gene_type:complete
MKHVLYFILFISISLFQAAMAAEQTRPRIGLVLSGGGAKGGAHVGVLKVIDQLNIPIDLVVGTSMGAVVGGLYASGYSAIEIENILTTMNWDNILLDKINRDDLYYRRKRDDDLFLIREVIGYRDGNVRLPRGAIQSQDLYRNYKKLTIGKEPIRDFTKLPISFAAVSTDLVTGHRVILTQGDLAEAMVASMSVPGIFPPVERNGQLLVDGGIVNNLPVEVAREMGADIIIAVDVGSPMYTIKQINNLAEVLGQLSNIYVLDNMKVSRELITDKDILLHPDISHISTSDYGKVIEAIKPGEVVALNQVDRLKRLSYGQTEKEAPSGKVYIKRSRVYNQSPLCTDTIYHYLPKEPGFYSTHEINQYIEKLYGLSMFERISYGIDDGELYVTPHEKRWGPTYFQSALLLSSDFDGGSSFTFGLGATRTLINSLAGEYRVFGSTGRNTSLRLDYFQPITTDLTWFIEPNLQYERRKLQLTSAPLNINFALYQYNKLEGSIALGRHFGQWGRVSVGYSRAFGEAELEIGIPVVQSSTFNDGFGFALLEWDTFDNSYFPNNGSRAKFSYNVDRKKLGSDQNFQQVKSKAAIAKTLGKHSLLVLGEYNATVKGIPTANQLSQLGGLFRLSGYSTDQLIGVDSALFNAIYFYRIKEVELLPNFPFPLYLGFSAESGNTWLNHSSLFKHSFIGAGSVFLGFDTIIGPIYLGYGIAERGKKAAHLALGKLF